MLKSLVVTSFILGSLVTIPLETLASHCAPPFPCNSGDAPYVETPDEWGGIKEIADDKRYIKNTKEF